MTWTQEQINEHLNALEQLNNHLFLLWRVCLLFFGTWFMACGAWIWREFMHGRRNWLFGRWRND